MVDIGSYFPDLGLAKYADNRVKDWPLMKNPNQAIGITIFYFLAIYVFLPLHMKNRKPYELKTFIKCYNIFQVVSCFILIHAAVTLGWTGWDTFGCKPKVHSIQMSSVFWWTTLLKGIELIETIIFALRKKYNQISGLHLYHHVSTVALTWMTTKYAGSEMVMFPIFLNSSVHVLMYTYYFLSSLGPEMQRKLTFVKSKLTIIQLIQLITLFLYTLQAVSPNCKANFMFPLIYLPTIGINIMLFIQFYRKTYMNKKSE